MKALKKRAAAKKPLRPAMPTPTPMAEVDRIAVILWHTSQLSEHGRRYVLAAIATADAILNGHGEGR